MADPILSVLETDLRMLVAESKRGEGGNPLAGLFVSSQLPAIRESADKAANKIHSMISENKNVVTLLSSPDVVKPLILTCEHIKNPKLVLLALGAFQKLLVHHAVAPGVLREMLTALEMVEKLQEDSLKLRLLQIVLTYLQNPKHADQPDATCSLLSLCFRLVAAASAKGASPTVANTATATLRQAVALTFEHGTLHGVTGAPLTDSAESPNRQIVALSLLTDLVAMAAGNKSAWMKVGGLINRTLLLELLEALLLGYPSAFHRLPLFTQALRDQLCRLVEGLLKSAIDPDVDMSYMADCRLVFRLVLALAQTHYGLAKRPVAAFLAQLRSATGPACMDWQRLGALDVLRKLVSQPRLVHDYVATFEMETATGRQEPRVMQPLVQTLHDIVASFLKASLEQPHPYGHDGPLTTLASLQAQAAGAELVEHETPVAGHDARVAHTAFDCLLKLAASLESLTLSVAEKPFSASLAALRNMLASILPAPGGGGGSQAPTAATASLQQAAAAAAAAAVPGTPGTGSGRVSASGSSPLFSNMRPPPGSAAQHAAAVAAQFAPQPAAVVTAAGTLCQPLLSALTAVATRSDAVVLVQPCLMSIAVLAQCCSALELTQMRDACLLSLCELSLAPAADAPSGEHSAHGGSAAASASDRSFNSGRPLPSAGGSQSQQVPSSSGGSSLHDSAAAANGSGVPGGASPMVLASAASGGAAAGGSLSKPPSHPQLDVKALGGYVPASPSPHPHHQPAPLALLNVPMIEGADGFVMCAKNVCVLRMLLSVGCALAEKLGGGGWVHVVTIINRVDCVLGLRAMRPPTAEEIASGAAGGGKDSVMLGGHAAAQGTSAAATITQGVGIGAEGHNQLHIIATTVNSLFDATATLSDDAAVSFLSALSDVALREQPSQSGVVPLKTCALQRMVDTTLANLFRIHDLWGVFLAYIMEALRSSNGQVTEAALDALDRTITVALGPKQQQQQLMFALAEASACGRPPASPAGDAFTAAAAAPSQLSAALAASSTAPPPSNAAAAGPATPPTALPASQPQFVRVGEDSIENMLLVALESLFKEERREETRLGLLRIVDHVLQRHGEVLTRGWHPLLRLLATAAGSDEAANISTAFQCANLLCSDFLVVLPKELVPKALEVVTLYVRQKVVVNIGLTAIELLWSASDLLARSTGAAAAAAGIATAADMQRVGSASAPGVLDDVVAAAAAGVGAAATADGAGLLPPLPPLSSVPLVAAMTGTGRTDLSPEESVQLMLKVFTLLLECTSDERTEVRNCAVRTLLQAVCSNAGRFSAAVWHTLLWDLLLPCLSQLHHMSVNSSDAEMRPAEVSKGVPMLVHHSRNSERKQWDDTLAIALQGFAKVLKAHLPLLAQLSGIEDAWAQVMAVLGAQLATGRRTVTSPAAAVLSGVILSHGGGGDMPAWMWRAVLAALDKGVTAMADPASPAPLTARLDLITAVTNVYNTLRPKLEADDYAAYFLRWAKAFCCYPLGADDAPMHGGGLPPVQKQALALVAALAPIPIASVWPQALGMLCDLLCPLYLWCMKHEVPLPAAPPPTAAQLSPGPEVQASGTSGTATLGGGGGAYAPRSSFEDLRRLSSSSTSSAAGGGGGSGGGAAFVAAGAPDWCTAAALRGPSGGEPDLRVLSTTLSPAFMAEVVQLACSMYKDSVPSALKAQTLSPLLAALSQCMAMRYVPEASKEVERLWIAAAGAFAGIVTVGVPAVTVAHHSHKGDAQAAAAAAYPEAWESLVRSFEVLLWGMHLPFAPASADALAPAAAGSRSSGDGGSVGGRLSAAALAQQQQTAPATPPQGMLMMGGAGGMVPPPGASVPPGAATPGMATATPPQQPRQQPGGATAPAPAPQGGGGTMPPAAAAAAAAGAGAGAGAGAQPLAAVPELPESVKVDMLVIDTLTESVLTQCMYAPPAARKRFVNVLDTLATTPRALEPRLPPASRLSLYCLRQLHTICARGTSLQGSNHCLLDVALLALPLLLTRTERILRQYAADERAALEQSQHAAPHGDADAAAATSCSMPQHRTDELLAALDLLGSLTLEPVITDRAARSNPVLKGWIRAIRGRHNPQESKREISHLLAFFDQLCELVVVHDARARELVSKLLRRVGGLSGITSGCLFAQPTTDT